MRRIKKAVSFLSGTPFHPQWLIRHDKQRFLRDIGATLTGRVVDIGCADRSSRRYLDDKADYIGLDYYTAISLYGTTPDIFGDAGSLPFSDGCVDAVLLLDVLEHVQEPQKCLDEIHRVLVAGGKLVLAVPFMYPIHDAPHDYQRWTEFGIRSLLQSRGFSIREEQAHGQALVSACVLANLALCKTVVDSLQRRHPAGLLFVFLPVLIPLFNLLGLLSRVLLPKDDFMPYRYHVTAVRDLR
ncbi:MAG: class I SAM-dependent methyltransferase [Gammaproteobacteria bacterium]